jgi:hypothetical protein
MAFLKNLFHRQEKPKPEAMHGSGPLQSEAEHDAVRSRMEGEMVANRERRTGEASEDPSESPPVTPRPQDSEGNAQP